MNGKDDLKMTEKDEQSHIAEINRLHDELQSLATGALDRAIRSGELLCSVKSALGHGRWLSWLEDNVSFSERTAQNYMGVFQKRARLKSANVADLTAAYLELDKPSAKFADELAEFWVHHQFDSEVRLAGRGNSFNRISNCSKHSKMIEAVRLRQYRSHPLGLTVFDS